MAERRYEIVANMDGLYDEKTKAVTMNVDDKGILPFLCFRHHFINASLHRYEGNRFIGLYRDSGGYGYVRYCIHCKKIDCVHDLVFRYYEVTRDKFYSTCYSIGHCQKCHKRILTSSHSKVSSSQEARDLIEKVRKQMGVNINFGFDFDTIVSQIIEDGGNAENYTRCSFSTQGFNINSMKT